MTSSRVPLAVLDLVPVPDGGDARTALRNSIELAQLAEGLGYRRHWLAEHHLNPGIAGSASLAFLGLLAAATSTIRVATAATLAGHTAPLQIAEAAGLVATLFDGRVDVGLGRTGPKPVAGSRQGVAAPAPDPAGDRVVDGLLVPAPARTDWTRGRFGLLADLLAREPFQPFGEAVESVLAFLEGTFVAPDGGRVPVLPAEGSGAAVWIHGSSGGESAAVAGRLGLPFGANYHSTPAGVLDSVAAYRAAFRPGRIAEPYVAVSADVLVAPTADEAAHFARGFDSWVLSIRRGDGTIVYPAPDRAQELDAADAALVADRVRTRFVGAPADVVAGLEALQRATGADELLVTTGAHTHAARVRSYELLAEAWAAPAEPASAAEPADRASSAEPADPASAVGRGPAFEPNARVSRSVSRAMRMGLAGGPADR